MDDEVRMSTLRSEISARLRAICSKMTEQEFDALVESIARNTRNAELRNQAWGPTTRPK